MILVTKRAGRRTKVRFMPGCLVMSLVLSIGVTILVNLIFRIV